MTRVLADPEIGGFTVTRVLDKPEYEIRRAVDEFLADRERNDLVVVYLSCHGVLDARGRLYFTATDTTKDRLSSSAVESAWLLDRLEECRAQRQVVILDCCFSGAFANTKGGDDVELERGRAWTTSVSVRTTLPPLATTRSSRSGWPGGWWTARLVGTPTTSPR